MHRWALALVGALVVLAGCGTFASAGTATPGETVTPAPVTTAPPTETPLVTPAGGSLPPGVSADGDVDFDRLFAAHARQIQDTSRRLVKREVQRQGGEDGHVVVGTTLTVAVENDTHYRIEKRKEQRGAWRNESVYRDPSGEYVYERSTVIGASSYKTFNEEPLELGPDFYDEFRYSQFVPENSLNASVSIAPVDRGGETLYRVHITDPASTRGIRAVTVRNYTFTLYVRPDGLIQSFHVAYDGHAGSVRTHYEMRVTYRDIGETTVREPSWVAAFERNRTAGNATGG